MNILIQPFLDYSFMMKALIGCFFIVISAVPIGVFLQLKRISLLGEGLSHALLPGLALGYFVAGTSSLGLMAGGIFSGLGLIWMNRFFSNVQKGYHDTFLGCFYLIFLSLGVILLTAKPLQTCHISHFLFGNILAIDQQTLKIVVITSAFLITAFISFYKPFVYTSFDPIFSKQIGLSSEKWDTIFLSLVVISLVSSCQGLGTLMGLGVMLIPAACGRLLCRRLLPSIFAGIGIGLLCSYAGLILSFFFNWPSGPLIVFLSGIVFVVLCASKTSL